MIFGFSKAEKLTHEQRSAAGRFDVKESRFSIINESHHCVTLAASLAAQQGPTSMAAFQVCLQVWLAVSLLADGLVVARQNWNGVRTLGVPKELMTAHGRHRSYSFILGLGFSGVC
ncbi:Protein DETOXIFICATION 42 [Glycine soja]|uniref:Protein DETOXIFICATION 42 n=1 Tax=Glycine soja TaxID=3848 RepID=A0A445FTK1_GLYSO|nr:Protein DETOXIFICATION 42 [Glycine soja]